MSNDLQPGSTIDSYVLDSYLGGGGFGAVWRGHDSTTGDRVAIKFLTGAFSSADTARVRAEIELLAAAAGRESPHVVRVLGSGFHGAPYIVLEFIEGEDLEALIRAQGRLSVDRTIEVGLAVGSALDALNQAGIVHRDIKPANVMIDHAGVIKLADFGIAKIVGYETITMTGHAAMTMAYAAPEMWEDDSSFGVPSHKSDLYAMGVLLFECLTGVPPFRGNYGALYKAHTQLPPDLGALPRGTPASLRTLLLRCLAKRQYDRPRDAAECTLLLRRAEIERREVEGVLAVGEPRHFGPWQRVAPHATQPYAWHCRHESSGVNATVEIYFTDDLDDGRNLRRANEANASLAVLGAERLYGTNRLLLTPGQEWAVTPPGRFEFWVAREDREVAPATTVGLSTLCPAIVAIASMIGEAAQRGLAISLASRLVLTSEGSVYLQRPGLPPWPEENPEAAARTFIAGLPLDPAALQFVSGATDFPSLVRNARNWLAASVPVTMEPSANETQVAQTVRAPVEAPRPAPPVIETPEPPPARIEPPAAPAPPPIALSLTRTRVAGAVCEYEMTIHNSSAQPVPLRLRASDERDALAFSLPATTMLQPGAAERVAMRVFAKQRRRFGGKQTSAFSVEASAGAGGFSGPPVAIDGEFEETPPQWPMFAGAGVFGMAVFAVAAAIFLLKGDGKTESLVAGEGTPTPIPTARAVSPNPVLTTTIPTAAAPATLAPPATPVPQPNRLNCNAIRGTAYQSEAERIWFQANCSGTTTAPPVATVAPGAPTSTPAPAGPTAPAAGTYTINRLLSTGGGIQATLTTIDYAAGGRLTVNTALRNMSTLNGVVLCQDGTPDSILTQGSTKLIQVDSYCARNPTARSDLPPNAVFMDFLIFQTSGLDANQPLTITVGSWGTASNIYLRR